MIRCLPTRRCRRLSPRLQSERLACRLARPTRAVTKFVVTGASGQLGHSLVCALRSDGHDAVGLTRSDVDVTDRSAVLKAIRSLAPDVVINSAAMTAVDACESDRAGAFAANADAPRWVVEACDAVGARAVLISTDYVFNGELDRPYNETDLVDPRSVYGESKLAGERVARDVDLVVRTSWLCSARGANILKTVLRLASEGKQLSFVTDQIGHPSFANDVARAMIELVDIEACGIAHVTNKGATSWYGFVKGMLEVAGHPTDLVSPITTDQLDPPRPAPRPANSVLDNSVPRQLGVGATRHWRDALADVVRELDV